MELPTLDKFLKLQAVISRAVKQLSSMALANNSGKMVLNMKGSGARVKHKVTELSFT
jgi:hypothetical protein